MGAGASLLLLLESGVVTFSPSDISNGIMWLDADDASTITESSGAVSQWDDKFGNGNNAVQATGANQPITGTRTQNSKNVIDFDGDNDLLRTASFTGGSITQPYTIFCVGALDVAGGTTAYLLDGIDGTDRIRFYNLSSAWRYFAGTINTSVASDTSPHVHSLVFNSTSSEHYIAGSLVDTGDTGTNALGGITVGASYTGSFEINGFMAEIIVYDKLLSTAEREQVEAYLSTKWGI